MTNTSTSTKAPARSTRAKKANPAAAVDLDVVNNETGQTADEVKTEYVATATGRGGRTCSRRCGTVPATHATDVANDEAKAQHLRLGAIWTFHSSAEAAERQAAKYRAKGLDAIVVEATSTPLAT